MIRNFFLIGLLCFLPSVPVQAETVVQPLWRSSGAGIISAPILNEISGLARSHWDSKRLWVLNDSGNDAALYAISTTGELLGTVKIEGAKNRDWESLASFRLNGKNYLVIGDTGDNLGVHKSCRLYLVEEPRILSAEASLKPVAMTSYTYEDGPKDVESIAVDTAAKKILLMSKREKVTGLYELPLLLKSPATPLVAGKTASMDSLPQPTEQDRQTNFFMAPYLGQVTDMNLSPDGNSLAVLTYQDVFLYRRQKGETWAAAALRAPQVLPRHNLIQAEALCFSMDGQSIFVTSERKISSPLLRYDLAK